MFDPYTRENILCDNELSNVTRLLIQEGSEILRQREKNEKKEEKLQAKGISASILKLTRIFPIEKEILKISREYEKIFFFEEGTRNGSIAEKLSSLLYISGYKGKFYITAVEGFVKQAKASSALKKYKLDCDGIAQTVISECENEKQA